MNTTNLSLTLVDDSGLKLEVGFLTASEISSVNEIMTYDFSEVRDRLVTDNAIPAEQVDEAIMEFKRFLVVILLAKESVGMISKIVDEVWHAFILFTKDYTVFTNKVFGRYLHHQPNTNRTPVPSNSGIVFVASYERLFGRLPTIWLPRSEECSGTTNCQDHDCISCQDVPKCHSIKLPVLGCSSDCEPPPSCVGEGNPCYSVKATISQPAMVTCVIEGGGQCELVCESD